MFGSKSTTNKGLLAVFMALGAILLGCVYYLYDPVSSAFFPRCPVVLLTGFRCPGCGSQRALHALLHGDIAGVWDANPMIPLMLPVLAAIVVAESFPKRFPRLLRGVTTPLFVYLIAAGLILWTIARNLFDL